MAEPSSYSRQKEEREDRLRWQSQLLSAAVFCASSMGLIVAVHRAPTAATAEGLTICAVFGVLVWLLRAATPGAALTGFVLTACMYLGTVHQPNGGWLHTALLPGFCLFVLAFAATRFRRGRKEQRGLAESRKGRRASQITANMGIAALASISALFIIAIPVMAAPIAAAAMVAALAEAAADTISSEIGQALAYSPWLITTGKRVAPGTDGAISVPGTAAGCLAASLVVFTAVFTLQLTWTRAAVVWLAAICGLFCDSLLGATVERRGWLNNDFVNFVSTAIAALVAFSWR